MIWFPFVIVLASSSVMAKLFDIRPEHTAKIFIKAPPVLYSSAQNRFLSLSQEPTQIYRGSEEIKVEVPGPINSYIWELAGFYLAKDTGEHTFSIGETKFANIQLGWKRKHSQYFHHLLTDETHIFSNSPTTFSLTKGEFYPIKIAYIAGQHSVPISVECNGLEFEVNTEIQNMMEDPTNMFSSSNGPSYVKTGFSYFVFLAPPGNDYEAILKDYGDYNVVQYGYFKTRHVMVRPESLNAPYIMEITGHIQPPVSGKYSVSFGKMLSTIIQVGPAHAEKQKEYIVDETWNIFDDRMHASPRIFELDQSFYYPFRLVVLADQERFRWSMSVNDPQGLDTDLFGLWERVATPQTPTGSQADIFTSGYEPSDEDSDSFAKIGVSDLPEDQSLSFTGVMASTPQNEEVEGSSPDPVSFSAQDDPESSTLDENDSWEYLEGSFPAKESSLGDESYTSLGSSQDLVSELTEPVLLGPIPEDYTLRKLGEMRVSEDRKTPKDLGEFDLGGSPEMPSESILAANLRGNSSTETPAKTLLDIPNPNLFPPAKTKDSPVARVLVAKKTPRSSDINTTDLKNTISQEATDSDSDKYTIPVFSEDHFDFREFAGKNLSAQLPGYGKKLVDYTVASSVTESSPSIIFPVSQTYKSLNDGYSGNSENSQPKLYENSSINFADPLKNDKNLGQRHQRVPNEPAKLSARAGNCDKSKRTGACILLNYSEQGIVYYRHASKPLASFESKLAANPTKVHLIHESFVSELSGTISPCFPHPEEKYLEAVKNKNRIFIQSNTLNPGALQTDETVVSANIDSVIVPRSVFIFSMCLLLII